MANSDELVHPARAPGARYVTGAGPTASRGNQAPGRQDYRQLLNEVEPDRVVGGDSSLERSKDGMTHHSAGPYVPRKRVAEATYFTSGEGPSKSENPSVPSTGTRETMKISELDTDSPTDVVILVLLFILVVALVASVVFGVRFFVLDAWSAHEDGASV